MRFAPCLLATFLTAGLVSPPVAGGESAPAAGDLADLAGRLVRAYNAGEVESLTSHLAPELVFRDPGLNQSFGLDGFVELAGRMGAGERDRALEITWIGTAGNRTDVRGTWGWTDVEGGQQQERLFSIELEFETVGGEPRVVAWLDDFRRRRMWKPARGDGSLETEHFRLDYFTTEFSAAAAARLGETFEHWYEEARRYLGRSFAEGYRLRIDVAGAHASPYATDPGPEAFILVPLRSARRDYGFSLVHELTHNLMGLAWLSRHERERAGVELASGNRLFDEGFAVYVEEKLTGEGPRVWPNFGEETHAAYWRLWEQAGRPSWPVLEAEIYRQGDDQRLGYLAQASFCKYLVEAHGLGGFLRLFAGSPASAKEIYGRDFSELEREWREFLEGRFGKPAAPGWDRLR